MILFLLNSGLFSNDDRYRKKINQSAFQKKLSGGILHSTGGGFLLHEVRRVKVKGGFLIP